MDFEEIRDDFMSGNCSIKVHSVEEAEDALDFLKNATGKTNNAWRPSIWKSYPYICYSLTSGVISGSSTVYHRKTVLWCDLIGECQDVEIRSEDIIGLI